MPRGTWCRFDLAGGVSRDGQPRAANRSPQCDELSASSGAGRGRVDEPLALRPLPPGVRRSFLVAAGALVALIGLACVCAPPAAAQAWSPERAVTIVVPFAPGGIADLHRACGRRGHEPFARPAGGDREQAQPGSIVASQAVAQAGPEGHTLLLVHTVEADEVQARAWHQRSQPLLCALLLVTAFWSPTTRGRPGPMP